MEAIKKVADANGEEWRGFCVTEPEGMFQDDFTDEQWNECVQLPEGSKVTADAVRAIMAEHVEWVKLKEVQDRRHKDYPEIGAQLDYIYHNGIEKWKTDIVDPVKAKHPKP